MTEDTRLDPPSLEIEGSRATIRLHRSRHRNRVEPGDIIRIMDYLEQVDANPSLRVLILAASGPAFSAGFHLGGFAEDKEAAARAPSFEAMADRFESVRVPTICRLQGGVYGGSTDFALAADFRIGVTGMEMFMPAARLGVHYYPTGLERYVSRLGLNNAKRLFLTAEKLGAEELLRIGYLTHLVAPEELDAAVDTLARLTAELESAKTSLARVQRIVFGSSSETTAGVLGEANGATAAGPVVLLPTAKSIEARRGRLRCQ